MSCRVQEARKRQVCRPIPVQHSVHDKLAETASIPRPEFESRCLLAGDLNVLGGLARGLMRSALLTADVEPATRKPGPRINTCKPQLPVH